MIRFIRSHYGVADDDTDLLELVNTKYLDPAGGRNVILFAGNMKS